MQRSRKIGFAASLALVAVIAASMLVGVSKVSATCGLAYCWTQASSPNAGTSTSDNYLNSVYAVSTKLFWAVGDYNSSGTYKTLIEKGILSGISGGVPQYTWSIDTTSQNQGSGSNYLNGVSFARNDLSATDVWAVGYYVNSSGKDQTLIEKQHSTSWSIVSSPNKNSDNNVLNGVSGNSASNYWAAGYYYNTTDSRNETLVEVWNGSGWNYPTVLPPNHGSDNNYLTSVSVLSSNDVWVAGYYVDASSGTTYPMTIHWNGSSWSLYYPSDSNERLDAISFVGSGSGHIGGWNPVGFADAYAAHWNGSQWVSESTVGSRYHAMDYNSTNSTWAVGGQIHFAAPDTTHAAHWDGTSWSNTNSVDPSSDCALLGVSAIATTNVWSVGYYRDIASNQVRTLIEHYN